MLTKLEKKTISCGTYRTEKRDSRLIICKLRLGIYSLGPNLVPTRKDRSNLRVTTVRKRKNENLGKIHFDMAEETFRNSLTCSVPFSIIAFH